MTGHPIAIRADPAAVGEIGGRSVVLSYAGVATEYEALHRHAVVFDRSHRGRMRLSGATAGEMLTGLVTNDVLSLASGQGQYAAALEADMIMRFGDTLNADSVEALEKVFAQYEAACQLDPTLAEAQSKRRETGSYLMNMRAMVQQYGIEGTREMLRQERPTARDDGGPEWHRVESPARSAIQQEVHTMFKRKYARSLMKAMLWPSGEQRG